MLARIELTYEAREVLSKGVGLQHWAELAKIFDSMPPSQEDAKEIWRWPQEHIIDLDTEGQWLLEHGITFALKRLKGTTIREAFKLDQTPTQVYVQVPHVGLLTINEVTVKENCCTDTLQEMLDEGWMLLCVCPPNATRRPDYILGRQVSKERT
jgi:hypothetical protein